MGNEFINTVETALKELQRLECQQEKEAVEQAAWDNEIIAEFNATSKGEKRMDKRTRKKQVDKFKKIIGWRDSLCNDAGEMPVGRFLITGERLLISKGAALKSTSPILTGIRTLRSRSC